MKHTLTVLLRQVDRKNHNTCTPCRCLLCCCIKSYLTAQPCWFFYFSPAMASRAALRRRSAESCGLLSSRMASSLCFRAAGEVIKDEGDRFVYRKGEGAASPGMDEAPGEDDWCE